MWGQNVLKACFLTHGPIGWASCRLRGYWVADELDDVIAIEFKPNDSGVINIPMAENYVWMKKFNFDIINETRDKFGAKHFWDVCDPMWWFSPENSREMAKAADGIVVSSFGLKKEVANTLGKPSDIVEDRFKRSWVLPENKRHENFGEKKLIWFGAGQNRIALFGALTLLERLYSEGERFSLTIFDDLPHLKLPYHTTFPIKYVKYSLEKEVEVISSHDIAILPKYPGIWGEVKSDNKVRFATLCGLPVSSGDDYEFLSELLGSNAFRTFINKQEFDEVLQESDVALSANQWEGIWEQF